MKRAYINKFTGLHENTKMQVPTNYYRMKNFVFFLLFLTFLLGNPFGIFSQETKVHAQGNINFFMDCDACDLDYVRQKLPFLSFVRDPKLADVHLLVSDSDTGSGGKKYFMNFIGAGTFERQNYQYEFIASQSDTEDDIRKGLLNVFKAGILPYLSQSGYLTGLNVEIEKIGKKSDQLVNDPWKHWVFRIESGGELEKEETQNEYYIRTEVRADKITEAWKTRLVASYGLNRENYWDDNEKITNKQNEKELSGDLIKSLNRRWSCGIFSEYSSSTYTNIKHSMETDIAMEYNFYDWEESNRRIFSLGYHLGIKNVTYQEETIYNKNKETLPYHNFEIRLELVQPWGNIETSIEGSQYFHDFSKNRLTLESDVSIRLTKQLSFFGEIQCVLIHDQLYLVKGEASMEDLLLKRRKLATTYEIGTEIGIRLTFGSIFNNVVNERF